VKLKLIRIEKSTTVQLITYRATGRDTEHSATGCDVYSCWLSESFQRAWRTGMWCSM